MKALLTVAAVLAVAALARPARATTTVDGGTVDLNDSTTEWAQDSTSLGTFGAGYQAGYTVQNSGSSSQSVSAYASLNAEMFGKSFQVADISGTGNDSDASLDVYIGTTSIASVPSAAYGSSSLQVSKGESIFEQQEEIDVGIPLSVDFALEATESVSLTGSATGFDLTWTLTPDVQTDVSAAVGIGVPDFSVGVNVSCSILDLSLPITLGVDYLPSTNQVQYGITGTLGLTSLAGSIAAYAKALFLEYDYTLFSWNGITLANWILFTDDKPTATNPVVDMSTGWKATASYGYNDAAGISESGSTYDWYLAFAPNCSSSGGVFSCSGSDDLQVNSTNLRGIDIPFLGEWTEAIYLQFCVTPSNGINPGQQVCSPWTQAGYTVAFAAASKWIDSVENNQNMVGFFYNNDNGGSATCFNLPSDWDNTKYLIFYPAKSLDFTAPASGAAALTLYDEDYCTGNSLSSGSIKAGQSWTPSLSDYSLSGNQYGWTTWAAATKSFSVVYGDVVAANVQLSLVPEPGSYNAYLNYSFKSAASRSESGSTYTLQEASDGAGTGATTISSGSISANMGIDSSATVVTGIPGGEYVNFCVTPSDGLVSGTQVCSGWTLATTRVAWYQGESWTGSWLPVSVPNGACMDIATISDSYVGFPKSLVLYSPSNSQATIYMYTGSGCTGTQYTRSSGIGNTHSINLDTVGIGSNIKSYQVVYDQVWAADVGFSFSGSTATGSYTYYDNQSLAEQGTTYAWERASDGNGTNLTTVGTSASYTVTSADASHYLRFCVTPSDGTVTGSQSCSDWIWTSCGGLTSGQSLPTNTGVMSCSNGYILEMQSDGNLVEYSSAGKALWASNTSGHAGATVSMQGDGNLVIYQNGTAIWASNTSGHSGATLAVQGSDGNVVIYQNGSALWATGT